MPRSSGGRPVIIAVTERAQRRRVDACARGAEVLMVPEEAGHAVASFCTFGAVADERSEGGGTSRRRAAAAIDR